MLSGILLGRYKRRTAVAVESYIIAIIQGSVARSSVLGDNDP